MVAKPPETGKKTNLPRAERKFILVKPGAALMPAPSTYDPVEALTDGQKKMKKKVEFLAYKKYKEKREEVRTRNKAIKTRVDEWAANVLSSLKDGVIQKNPSALPVHYMTFSRFALSNPEMTGGKKVTGPKGLFFIPCRI
jgi:CRISPR/Cas system CSM-associated protein Csm4 (group 5 of RAMP superfamily)